MLIKNIFQYGFWLAGGLVASQLQTRILNPNMYFNNGSWKSLFFAYE